MQAHKKPKNITQYDELEELLENESLETVETFAEGYHQDSSDNYCRYIMALQHIANRELFRENPRYEKADFRDYLRDRWNMTETTLHHAHQAFVKFPEAARLLGSGPIIEAIKQCAPAQLNTAVERMVTAETQTRQGLTPPKKREILKQHARPMPRIPKTPKIPDPPKPKTTPKIKELRNWKREYYQAERERKDLLRDYKEIIVQNAKLKAALLKARAAAQEYKTALERWAE